MKVVFDKPLQLSCSVLHFMKKYNRFEWPPRCTYHRYHLDVPKTTPRLCRAQEVFSTYQYPSSNTLHPIFEKETSESSSLNRYFPSLILNRFRAARTPKMSSDTCSKVSASVLTFSMYCTGVTFCVGCHFKKPFRHWNVKVILPSLPSLKSPFINTYAISQTELLVSGVRLLA